MIPIHRIDLGFPSLLDFKGPDTVRFLNGQLTQDVRRLTGQKIALPSCITDAKGKLQFRVWIMESHDGSIRIEGPPNSTETLTARLTRYLIADDVEVSDLTGKWSLIHFTGPITETPPGVVTLNSARFGVPGTDWWIPHGLTVNFPRDSVELSGDALEIFRIEHGIPAWGKELHEGILPPEAGLDATDVSYHKGCYIGQEVISRIKSAGKLNKTLERLTINSSTPIHLTILTDADGQASGNLTSISPQIVHGIQHALGYLKRGAIDIFITDVDGVRHPVSRCL